MHFRDRGRSVQLVRTTYNSETKKPETEVVGKLSRPSLNLAEDVKAKLKPEELAEVEQFRSRTLRRENVDLEYSVSQFPQSISKVIEWLKSADAEAAAALADEVQKPLSKLRRQLIKAGSGEAGAK
jgi:hypothetical protein